MAVGKAQLHISPAKTCAPAPRRRRPTGPSVAHAEYALRECGRQLHYAAATADFTGPRAPRPLAGPVKEWADARRAELRATMWRAAGIVRREAELRGALEAVASIAAEAEGVRARHGVAAGLVELSNLATCAELVLACALQRRESRGLHYTPDYPSLDPASRPSLVSLRPPVVAGGGGGGKGGGSSAQAPRRAKKAKRPAQAPAPAPAAQREMVVRSTPRDQE